MSLDAAASARARLLNLARARREDFQLYLARYAAERFLYRLGRSPHLDDCVVKGAGLLILWMDDPYRPTRDLDLLASGANDADAVRNLVHDICSVDCPEDGLEFDLDTLDIAAIRAIEEYQGQRARMTARLGQARIRLQIDFGFGDAVTPEPEVVEYPKLLGNLPTPVVRAYRREVTIAEKFEAMVKLGRRNSRMKDFHDVWALSSQFSFEGGELLEAVRACFDRRRTSLTELPDVLRPEFYTDERLTASWRAYVAAGTYPQPPPDDFAAVGTRVRAFLGPVRDALFEVSPLASVWSADDDWRTVDPTTSGRD